MGKATKQGSNIKLQYFFRLLIFLGHHLALLTFVHVGPM